jgi:S-adenosylmethionine:tRNA ribosyltransferase-isomerase
LDLLDFSYDLPEELIAQEPRELRDSSRLMVIRQDKDVFEHREFKDILHYLKPGDNLIVNDTKVIPARLLGTKKNTGARMEVLLLKRLESDCWEALVKPGKRAPAGTEIAFGDGSLTGHIIGNTPYGGKIVEFKYKGLFDHILDSIGIMPVPPYIKKPLSDRQRYQTVYAREAGSAAAPTAGLHFSKDLLTKIKALGVNITPVLLHVGLGTFRPVEVRDIELHRMHPEYFEISQAAADAINRTRQQGGRIIAVGTTTTRCLESAAEVTGRVRPGSGWTDIFIYPGYRFKVIDGLVTNFHLPKSTLLMMVSALAGRERILSAYKEAVRQKYRFFSFGDAMLIL